MQEPNSSPSNLYESIAAELGPHELASNTIVSIVSFYAGALAQKRRELADGGKRIDAAARAASSALQKAGELELLRAQEKREHEQEVERLRSRLEGMANGLLRLTPLLKALSERFEPHKLEPGAFNDTLLQDIYDAWLALRAHGKLDAGVVPERGDSVRAEETGPRDGHA